MIYDSFEKNRVNSKELDEFLADGYRHFGTHFFRYSISELEDEFVNVVPLRINLKKFSPTNSQKKVLRKNKNARVEISKPKLNEELHTLFDIHKQKFTFGIPPSIHSFLGEDLDFYPNDMVQVSAYDGDRLYSISYLDLGRVSTSSIYGFYDPDYSRNSPGIYTMLLEIDYSIKNNFSYYYSGYCHDVSSYYDYKKNFNGLEYYNWDEWVPYEK